nr:MAG TPA: DNA repair protein endonuclease SAE2/CtIP C-terminus [Caudoviricetes sp.]
MLWYWRIDFPIKQENPPKKSEDYIKRLKI